MEIGAAYVRGFQAGRDAERAALHAWVEEFIAAAPEAAVVPLDRLAAAVVSDLIARFHTTTEETR